MLRQQSLSDHNDILLKALFLHSLIRLMSNKVPSFMSKVHQEGDEKTHDVIM